MEYIRSYTDPIMKLDILKTTEKKTTEEADKIMKKYPDRIPAIVHKNPKSTNTPDIDKHKYLVPIDLTMGQLMYVIRKRIKLSHEQALFLFVNGSVASNTELVSSIYDSSYDPEDRFLHIMYSCENVFGSTF